MIRLNSNYNLTQIFDLVIIGGGINGAGLAREAAERGLKVLLLEKNDFGSGCSAHSTRLIHGGLRYLEFLEFNLVQESLQERELLLKQYPHLIQAIPLLIPAYSNNKRSLLELQVGMWLYDWLSWNKSLPKYRKFSKSQTLELTTKIKEQDLQGSVFYYDAQVPFVERLVLENILTAEKYGAICLNHCEVTEIITSKAKDEYIVSGLKFKDLLKSIYYTIEAKYIVNLSGPWVDKINQLISNDIPQEIAGTKGSHIVVKSFKGAPKDFGIYNEAKSDGRPFFILPYQVGANEILYLIGTTDILINPDSDIDHLKISEAEIDYLLKETNILFPEANLRQEDIVKSFAGLRPLPKSQDLTNTAKITRRHFIINEERNKIQNYYSIVGGKITTFRSLAEEIANLFTEAKSKSKKNKTINAQFPNPIDLQTYSEELAQQYMVSSQTALHLVKLYGSSAKNVLELTRKDPKLKAKLDEDFEDIEAQVIYAIQKEKAYTVEDIILRRLSIGLCTDKIKDSTKSKVADILERLIQ